jgi:hypothetical protein
MAAVEVLDTTAVAATMATMAITWAAATTGIDPSLRKITAGDVWRCNTGLTASFRCHSHITTSGESPEVLGESPRMVDHPESGVTFRVYCR